MNKINKLAFAIFGKHVRKNRERYPAIRAAVRHAHVALPWDIYVSTALLYAVISGIIGAASGYVLMPLLDFAYGGAVFILVTTLLLSLFTGLAAYYGIIAYPKMIARVRKSKIDLTLPHAVAYMHAMSKGGLNLISIFKSLSQHVNIYGEAAEEFRYIMMDTELHGSDLVTALKNAAVRTQSDKFRDFLENLITVTETGGDMEMFFGNIVNSYQSSAASEQRMYLETLGMLAEIYITAFVAGPLFLITIFIVMGMMGPGNMLMLETLVYVVIPLSAVSFSVLLSAVSLGSDTKLVKIYSVSKKIKHYDDVRVVFSEEDLRLARKLRRSIRWMGANENRKNPLKPFFSDPFKVLYFTAPSAILYFFITTYQSSITVDTLDDSIVISLMILLVPFLLFYEMQSRRIRAIEGSLPAFLRRLAVINDVGMPLADAIKSISRINLGVLSTEVKLMHKDIVWSSSIASALLKFERRVRTVSISRIVTLITKASESTGNIKETLRVAATDAALAEKLRREKFTVLYSYLIVVYMSFAVFLLVLYVFAKMFLPMIPADISNYGTGSGMLAISTQKEEYTRLFMHASVIQGFFSGIISGQMMGESVCDGLKHSVLMMGAAYVFFVWFI